MPMLTAMSSRGQIVLPKKIRTKLNLSEGTQFIVLSDADNILLKPVKIPSLSEFSGVLRKAREWASAAGMTEEDVTDAIKAVRAAEK
ncbi:MAG: AbrB/MazE/SpoVT family DNA-binding domain-containing protein [Victivallales bacterium]|nr:AbrB/MazE/SpoVT family DNA-binding domain-containing protein [Victivallales bacterium]MBQ7650699.1 AbrB/MazE/SpoVT family DNA-binding domain-containing protein [Victivallales bacterium]